jgi:hypothetical protein
LEVGRQLNLVTKKTISPSPSLTRGE